MFCDMGVFAPQYYVLCEQDKFTVSLRGNLRKGEKMGQISGALLREMIKVLLKMNFFVKTLFTHRTSFNCDG